MSSCPVSHDSASLGESSCPVIHGNNGTVENNPLNNMPKVAEQSVWPGQAQVLSTDRQISTIPKGEFTPIHQKTAGEEPTWVYPSEQQFYNAMKRKGWDAKEQDMPTVVAIHNAVNERTWIEVLKWEKKFHCECENPRLLKFMGRPKDLSPKARLMTWFGYTEPFDRHDWIVDRCGTEVRYIVDFYRGKPSSFGYPITFHVDARPALDSTEALKDRIKMTLYELLF